MTKREILKRFGMIGARELLLFMSAAVLLKLFLQQEWKLSSTIFAFSWAAGECVSYALRK